MTKLRSRSWRRGGPTRREIIGLALGALFCACITGKERPAATEDGSPADGVAREGLAHRERRPDATTVPGTWVAIAAGTFQMGSPGAEKCRDSSDETQHWVTLSHKFEISDTEVTQAQFSSVMRYNPSGYPGDTRPVETVTWHESAAYCNELSALAGKQSCYENKGSGTGCQSSSQCPSTSNEVCIKGYCSRYQERSSLGPGGIYDCEGYRLPTDAEWEYAYRAGTTTALYNGGLGGCEEDERAGTIGWYDPNATGKGPQSVKTKKENGWHLYDMAGNVAEWCNDWYLADLGTVSVADPTGPVAGSSRVLRNGSWRQSATALRGARRGPGAAYGQPPDEKGFRCVRSLTP